MNLFHWGHAVMVCEANSNISGMSIHCLAAAYKWCATKK